MTLRERFRRHFFPNWDEMTHEQQVRHMFNVMSIVFLFLPFFIALGWLEKLFGKEG